MQKIISFLSFLTLSINGFSQADYIPTAIANEYERVIGTRNKNIVMLVKIGNEHFIEQFDTTYLNRETTMFINIPQSLEVNNTFQSVFLVDNVIKVVVLSKTVPGNSFSLKVFDFDDLTGIILSSEVTCPISEVGMKDKIIIQANQKGNALLVGKELIVKGEKHYELFVLNGNSKILQKRTHVEVEEGNRTEYNTSEVMLDNQQRIVFQLKEIEYLKSEKKYRSNIALKTFSSSEQTEAVFSVVELPAGYACGDLMIHQSETRNCIVGTYLSFNVKQINGIRGLFSAAINSDGSLGAVNYTKYSDQTRAKSLQGADETAGVDVRPFYAITDCLTDESGNTYVIQERRTVTDLGYGAYEWYYGSLLVTKLSPDGTVVFDNLVWKSQFFKINSVPIPIPLVGSVLVISIPIPKKDEGYLSYKATLVNNELKLIFNDVIENAEKTPKQPRENYTKPKEGIPYVAVVAADGTYTYECRHDLSMDKEGHPYILQYGFSENGYLYTLSKTSDQELLSKLRF